MNGERAFELLEALLRGERGGATAEEIKLLERQALVVGVDGERLLRARVYDALIARYRIATLEGATARLAKVETWLRSSFHQMFAFASTRRREERERARLRGLVGAMRDTEEWARIERVREALAAVDPKTPWIPLERGETAIAVTRFGERALAALQSRLDRFGQVDLLAFLKRMRKNEAGMHQLSEEYRLLHEQLRHRVPKGVEHVVTGLLKTGLPPEQALACYDRANRHVRDGRLAVEIPHAATTLVRASQTEDPAPTKRRLDDAIRALQATGLYNGPVLRGAAKVLIGAPDLRRAVERFRALHDGLPRMGGEDKLRLAARLFPAQGSAPEVLARMNTAMAHLPRNAPAAAALAATATDPASLEALLARHDAIVQALVAAGAFSSASAVPASAADLVSVPGTPEQVVEIVRELVERLPGTTLWGGWGVTSDWSTAVAFARRFAF